MTAHKIHDGIDIQDYPGIQRRRVQHIQVVSPLQVHMHNQIQNSCSCTNKAESKGLEMKLGYLEIGTLISKRSCIATV